MQPRDAHHDTADGPRRVVLVLSAPTKTIRVHVRGLLTRLGAAGFDVLLAAPRSVLASFGDLIDVDRSGIVLPIGEELRPVHDLAAATTLRAALMAHGTEVVHAHGYRAGAVAALALRFWFDAPALVTTWHSVPYPGAGNRTAVHLGLRLVARSSSVTLASSAELRELAQASGAREARLSPVAAPAFQVPRDLRTELRSRLGEELGLRADVPWILTVGRIVPQKNHDLLLDASERWRGLHPAPEVLVVGVGSVGVVSRLRREISERRLPVHLLGARDDIAELMTASDVYVLTSRWEAPALSIQEAMRAGLPVVSTAVGGVPDLVGDTAVLVEEGDAEAFAVEVALLLGDPTRAEQLAEAARSRAASLPTEDDVAADVLQAYRDGTTTP